MIAPIVFEFPWAWLLWVPIIAALALGARRQRRRGLRAWKIGGLLFLRVFVLLPLMCLAARPVRLARSTVAAASRPVALLVDRSESMSLDDFDGTRYQQAVRFAEQRLLPAFRSAHLPVRTLLFDQSVQSIDAGRLASVTPAGRRTDLASAIVQAFNNAAPPPLAVVALTDGIANEDVANTRALGLLAGAQVPFIGVGFGNDQGVRTLSLRQIDAPATVAPRTLFSISAQIETVNSDTLPAFDLVLLRDGQVAQKKTVAAGKGSRLWLENFHVTEADEGVHNFCVQLVPPEAPNLRCVSSQAAASVRVSEEKDLRVLYVQGALTWDYKFVNRALHDDHAIKLTGLTRTSEQSVFRQNVETAGELLNGFPRTAEELAPFRVVVLSNLRPADLTPPQQQLLSQFCGEMGGGLLVMGGPATFDGAWQNTPLERLLPVVFSANPGVAGLDPPFQIQLTDEAIANPVFQIGMTQTLRQAWAALPTFTQYGRVDALKSGAQTWMVHPADEGPSGRRILMASQRYGAGLSAVLCVQNFWRWRLAKEADPTQYDRFWRQLFRFLGDVGRQDVAIHLEDQDLHSEMDVRATLERQPNPKNLTEQPRKFVVRALDSQQRVLGEQAMELEPGQPIDFNFHAGPPGVYKITVADGLNTPIASRNIEIRELNIEFLQTARNMETLQQWAAVSEGMAFKAEECPEAKDLVAKIQAKIEEARLGKATRRVVGVNGWTLTWVLACLSAEWLLRKRWGLA